MMMKILYYDCFSGISGDMNLGAMVDLGVDPSCLKEALKKLRLDGYELRICRDERRGIGGTRVEVLLPSVDSPPIRRNYRDIVRLVEESSLAEGIQDAALAIFSKIAEGEAKIHGCKPEEVHFHEVGAVDSIVDIVGAAICLDFLKVDRILSSPVEVGGGFVRCAHGVLPVPAPATAEILRGVPLKTGAVPFETTTPTGAAILAATVDRFTDRMDFTPRKIGYGIGHRDTEIPNVLRIFLGEMEEDGTVEEVTVQAAWMVECNLDDMSPELYEPVMEALLRKGALDVFLTPILMKKSRPAVTLSVLCDPDKRKDLEEILWLQTTTFGLRSYRVDKSMLKRTFSRMETTYGPVALKQAWYRGRRIKSKPEYEDCKRLAEEKGVSVREILDQLNAGNVE